MKKLLFLLLPFIASAQSFTFNPLPGTYQRNGVGNDNWQGQSGAQIVPNYHAPTIFYRRFTVPELVNPNGTYTFTRFNSFINNAIQNRQLFGFRIFTMYAWPECEDCHNFTPFLTGLNGSTGNTVTAMSAVPLEWHTAMQASSPRNWISESGDWVPAYNSSAFLTRFAALHEAINTNIMTGSFTPTWSVTPINYRDVIAYIDVSGFGTWGEWHSYASAFNNVVTTYPGYGLTAGNDQVAGSSFPSIATMKSIINAHKNAYDSFQLAIIINAFDNMRLPNTRIPAEVGVWAYQTRTAAGYWMGRRIDHAGDDTGYDDFYLQLNQGVFGGYEMDTAHNFRHRLAPFYGEPPGGPVYLNGINQGRLPSQARKWHWTSIGNGNWGGTSGVPTGQGADSVRLAFSIMGYHYRLTGGNYSLTASNFTVNLNWQNFGLTPTYNHWIVEYSLRNGAGVTVWTGNSTFDPYLYATEQGNTTKTDIFARPALGTATYTLWMRAKDRRNGYMTPMQLQIQGRDANGYYPMGSVTFTGAGNQLPTVNAGPNQSITGSSTTLTAVASDPDGSIASYAWSLFSGPSAPSFGTPTAASTSVSSLVAGTYEFNVTVTDNSGGQASDRVIVTRNNPVPPVAEAGANQTITLPTSSTTLNGSGTDADGTVVRYGWTQVGGPSAATIASPATASTGVSGLVSGTYSFRLTVTDNSDLSSTDDVNVIVQAGNTPPISNAGANATITLPTDNVNLSGSASTDPGGAITGYLWTKVGGPTTFTITSPGTVNTSVTGLVAGIYIFRLRVTDAGGLTHTDDVQVTVNAAPNGTPVASAGANQVITAPSSSVNVSSSGSSDDGGIVSRLWTKVSGPASFNITTPTATNTSITGLVPGVYSFRITVTDGGGLTAFDDVQITVLPAGNVAPVAEAGNNQSITLPTSSTSVSGSASTDADGTITSYLWTKLGGPAGGTISNTGIVNPNISALQAGTYTYRLRVTDNGGLIDDDDVQITVNPADNNAPIAVAGNNISLTLPATSTTLNGSGSSDPGGAIVTYSWAKISGPLNYSIATPSAASTNISSLVVGIYVFRLTVTDGAGLTDTDDVQVTVNSTSSEYKWWQFWRWLFRNR